VTETIRVGNIEIAPRGSVPPELRHLVPDEVDYVPQGQEMSALAAAYKYHKHVVLQGPAGCGKNEAIRYFCHLANIPMVLISMAEGTGIDQLIGTVMPKGMPGGGFTVDWCDGALPLAIRAGACFVMDEINAAEERVMMRVHDFFAKGERLTIYEDATRKGHAISPWQNGEHNGFFGVATMNPTDSGQYSGTKALNEATYDRFLVVEMNYLGLSDPKAESGVVSRQARVKLGRAGRIVKVANEIRRRAQLTEDELASSSAQPLFVVASTRRLIDIAVLSRELPIMRAVEIAFTNKINPENRPVVHKMFLDEFATDEAQADMAD
jgi:MoxR-like ATPase